jgi:hypothetical protein
LIGWCLTYFQNYSGHPVASIPAGFVDGLPVGMQLTGRRYADADVLTASAAFERLRPWYDSYARCGERSRLKRLRSIRCRREAVPLAGGNLWTRHHYHDHPPQQDRSTMRVESLGVRGRGVRVRVDRLLESDE